MHIRQQFGLEVQSLKTAAAEKSREELLETTWKVIEEIYHHKEEFLGPERMRHFEQSMFLQTVDNQWKDHLLALDHLKEGISLRGYGQKDPLVEYKKESVELFNDLLNRIDDEIVRLVWLVDPRLLVEHDEAMERRRQEVQDLNFICSEDGKSGRFRPKTVKKAKKIGRNAPCPCGSGKKYKFCCGRN